MWEGREDYVRVLGWDKWVVGGDEEDGGDTDKEVVFEEVGEYKGWRLSC